MDSDERLTSCRYAKEVWQSHGELGIAPCSCKVSCTHLFIDVDLQGIVVSTHEYAIDPYKEDIAIVAFYSCESQDGDPTEEERCLAQVLL